MWTHWKKKLQGQISSLFYTHGLFCASHPTAIICLVIFVVLILCYPLTTLPLPGNAPLELMTSLKGYTVPASALPTSAASPHHKENGKWPRWYQGVPLAYIQQIVVKAVASPWQPNQMTKNDAYRGPLAKSFDIMEQVSQFHYKSNKNQDLSISDFCLHVHETLRQKKVKSLVPEYNCLMVSPANFWGQDRARFLSDGEIIKTIYKKYGQALDAPPSIRDVLFGLPLKDTGIKRFYLRNRQRVISYAVSIVFKEYNRELLAALEKKLLHAYPQSPPVNSSAVPNLTHFFFQNVNYFVEYTPLLVTYVVLFMYIYFSVSKIEMVKSKWGLAFSAVVTVISSLMTSIGLCTMIGLTPSLNGSEIFPYLVVIIGLENVLVVTKSVVSTPVHLNVKLRVAQGLSKEGWYIFKNLLAELFILFVGFFTFVPAIQEFCLFALVGLISDFFLQMFFFATVLSIDLRRMELSDLQKQSVQKALQENSCDEFPKRPALNRCPVMNRFSTPPPPATGRFPRSKSDPHFPEPDRGVQQNAVIPPGSPSTSLNPSTTCDDMFFPEKIWRTPRRVRFMNYWARTRMLQRAIMVCVVIWIGLIVYKTGLVEYMAKSAEFSSSNGTHHPNAMSYLPDRPVSHDDHVTHGDGLDDDDLRGRHSAGAELTHSLLQHENLEQWRELSYNHWPTLLGYYNISLSGRYITILPSMHLSLVISPDEAASMRHPLDETLDEPEQVKETIKTPSPEKVFTGQPQIDVLKIVARLVRYPQTRKELVSTILLGIASTILLIYFFIKLYHCMCSRNYAKWRSSWSKNKRQRIKHSPYYKQIRESVPLILEGHTQEVECVVTDGPLVVSSCLGGQLRVWDSTSGECYTTIQRKGMAAPTQRQSIPGRNVDDSDADLYAEYHEQSPPLADLALSQKLLARPISYPNCLPEGDRKPCQHHSRHRSVDLNEIIPDLSSSIDTDFTSLYSPTKKQGQLSLPVSTSSPVQPITHTVTVTHPSPYLTATSPGMGAQHVASSLPASLSSAPYQASLEPGQASQALQQPSTAPSQAAQAPQQASTAPHHTSQAPQQASIAPHHTSQAPQQASIAPHHTSQAPQQASTAPHHTSQAPQQASPSVCQTSVPLPHQAPQAAHQAFKASHQASQATYQTSPALHQASQHQASTSTPDQSILSVPSLFPSHPLHIQSGSHMSVSQPSMEEIQPAHSQTPNLAQHQGQWHSSENIASLQHSMSESSNPGPSGQVLGHRRHKSYGFDFSRFNALYEEHNQMLKEKEDYMRKRGKRLASMERNVNGSQERGHEQEEEDSNASSEAHAEDPGRMRTSSQGEDVKSCHSGSSQSEAEFGDEVAPPIWCLACRDNLVVAGCANGRIEFWDGLSGMLKCIHHESKVGATAACFVANRIIVARLNGHIDFLELETFTSVSRMASQPPTSMLHNRGEMYRAHSLPGGTSDMKTWDDAIHVSQLSTARAHQRPINVLRSEGRRVVSASQDHTLKVFRLEDCLCLYTLHGHNGGVTALHLDKGAPLAAASGSEDGTVRLWDLLTGVCVHKLEGHYGTVVSLTCTPTYVVSTGMDDRLCIWERIKGHLLHWIQMEPGYCNSVVMLTSNLMVTGGQGCIYLWDVSKGHALRAVQLGDNDHSIFVHHLHVINNSTVVCDYGSQLRVIHFPAVLEKAD